MENTEISFKSTLSVLNDERNKALSLSGGNMYKTMHLIDLLTKKILNVMDKPLEDVVLIGSRVEVELNYGDGSCEILEYTVSVDFSKDDEISFYSPLGSNLLGKSVDSIVEYQVGDFYNRAHILSITNEKEKQKLLTNN